jgi:hypothetical protein
MQITSDGCSPTCIARMAVRSSLAMIHLQAPTGWLPHRRTLDIIMPSSHTVSSSLYCTIA